MHTYEFPEESNESKLPGKYIYIPFALKGSKSTNYVENTHLQLRSLSQALPCYKLSSTKCLLTLLTCISNSIYTISFLSPFCINCVSCFFFCTFILCGDARVQTQLPRDLTFTLNAFPFPITRQEVPLNKNPPSVPHFFKSGIQRLY